MSKSRYPHVVCKMTFSSYRYPLDMYIRVARHTVDSIIRGGCTANLCTIDLSKAFDKVNHYALYLKLMKRAIPNELLTLLECWLSSCYSCVKCTMPGRNCFILVLALGRV